MVSIQKLLNNSQVFVSRNYLLIVTSRKFDVLKTKILAQEAKLGGKYVSFKNIKFPRGNCETDSFQKETLFDYRFHCSPLNFLLFFFFFFFFLESHNVPL